MVDEKDCTRAANITNRDKRVVESHSLGAGDAAFCMAFAHSSVIISDPRTTQRILALG